MELYDYVYKKMLVLIAKTANNTSICCLRQVEKILSILHLNIFLISTKCLVRRTDNFTIVSKLF